MANHKTGPLSEPARGDVKMPTCSLECTPNAGVDGVAVFYNQYGECYTQRENGNLICAIRFELGSTDTDTEVAIHFYPTPGTDAMGTEQTPTLCPTTSGAARWADEGYGHVKIAFPVPTATNTEWGWDYVNPDLPPKLHIKIRVKRT